MADSEEENASSDKIGYRQSVNSLRGGFPILFSAAPFSHVGYYFWIDGFGWTRLPGSEQSYLVSWLHQTVLPLSGNRWKEEVLLLTNWSVSLLQCRYTLNILNVAFIVF